MPFGLSLGVLGENIGEARVNSTKESELLRKSPQARLWSPALVLPQCLVPSKDVHPSSVLTA